MFIYYLYLDLYITTLIFKYIFKIIMIYIIFSCLRELYAYITIINNVIAIIIIKMKFLFYNYFTMQLYNYKYNKHFSLSVINYKLNLN